MERHIRFALSVRATAFVAVLFIAGCAGVVSDQAPTVSGQPAFYRNLATPGVSLDSSSAQSMISSYRQNNGLPAVTIDPGLMRIAEEQARGMAARNKLDHEVIGNFRTRLSSNGYDAKAAAENISAGYHTFAEAFSGWRDSRQHRANMLLRDATRMGIAAAYAPNTKYKVFWALILAAPDDRRG
jgi:uncharacterized protein YkwD